MRKNHKSGIIPYYILGDVVRILLMKPSDPKFGGSAFQIAKGDIEQGDSIDNAIREGHEELGLRSSNIRRTWLVNQYEHIDIFASEIIDPTAFDLPGYETGETRWFELPTQLRYVRNWQIVMIKDFLKKVKNMHRK